MLAQAGKWITRKHAELRLPVGRRPVAPLLERCDRRFGDLIERRSTNEPVAALGGAALGPPARIARRLDASRGATRHMVAMHIFCISERHEPCSRHCW